MHALAGRWDGSEGWPAAGTHACNELRQLGLRILGTPHATHVRSACKQIIVYPIEPASRI